MAKRAEYLVVDSGAFIKNSPVHEYADKIYTVPGAIKEIKDKATLQRLQFLPYQLQVKEPSPDACKYVLDFSKKTGDFSNLSAVDMQIIALTYQLEKENVGTEHLNEEPLCTTVTSKSAFSENISGFYVPKKSVTQIPPDSKETTSDPCIKEEDTKDSDLEKETFHDAKETFHNAKETLEEGESDQGLGPCDDSSEYGSGCEDSDDESSWLTPANFSEIKEKMRGLQLDSSVTVACVTTDFSVQNVLIQIGLNVISVDGMLIKHTRVYILRCHSCFKTTNNITKTFCSNCGNKTLKRVAVSVNDDGSKKIHINFRRPIKVRGTRYSLPTPKGGKHGMNPRVCEDQPFPHNRLSKKALQRVDVMSEDYASRCSPFAFHDVYSRAANLAVHATAKNQYYLRKNPNEWGKRTGNKKKK